MDITTLHNLYTKDENALFKTINGIYDRIEREGLNPIWISINSREKSINRVKELSEISLEDRSKSRLYGIPFAVKDNIDVIGLPTTAGCPTFAKQSATESAPVVLKLEEAGAILIGKTNMDQFATGLVGTRSPYGVCSSVLNENFISGGSSSGSAVSVGKELVTFSLGSDTAGSGRVPAMFNNIIGLKPTRGLLSTRGVIPACRTLDCLSIFAETVGDAAVVFSIARGFDHLDPYSREGFSSSPWITTPTIRFGVPTIETRQFFGDTENPKHFSKSLQIIEETLDGQLIELDFQPFIEVADLLYKGPWVAERYAAVGHFLDHHENEVDPIVCSIIKKGKDYKATDVFNAKYQLKKLKKIIHSIWENFDVLIVPTAPRLYRIDEISSSPIELNSNLGYYTNFVNLLDLSAIAIPAGIREDGLPFGITIIGKSFNDNALLVLGDRIHRLLSKTIANSARLLDDTPKYLPSISEVSNCFCIGVVGAHLSGQPLNYQLTQRKGRLVRTVRTTNEYRLYALKGSLPAKPGLLRVKDFNGPGIELEIWSIPNENVATFIQMIPSPLSIGTIFLEDGKTVQGFLVEVSAIDSAEEITHFGGWRAYLNRSS